MPDIVVSGPLFAVIALALFVFMAFAALTWFKKIPFPDRGGMIAIFYDRAEWRNAQLQVADCGWVLLTIDKTELVERAIYTNGNILDYVSSAAALKQLGDRQFGFIAVAKNPAERAHFFTSKYGGARMDNPDAELAPGLLSLVTMTRHFIACRQNVLAMKKDQDRRSKR